LSCLHLPSTLSFPYHFSILEVSFFMYQESTMELSHLRIWSSGACQCRIHWQSLLHNIMLQRAEDRSLVNTYLNIIFSVWLHTWLSHNRLLCHFPNWDVHSSKNAWSFKRLNTLFISIFGALVSSSRKISPDQGSAEVRK
jgi:hypothetical protein